MIPKSLIRVQLHRVNTRHESRRLYHRVIEVERVPKLTCSECNRQIGMHELEAKTTAQSGEFSTRYRCPFCQTDLEDVTEDWG